LAPINLGFFDVYFSVVKDKRPESHSDESDLDDVITVIFLQELARLLDSQTNCTINCQSPGFCLHLFFYLNGKWTAFLYSAFTEQMAIKAIYMLVLFGSIYCSYVLGQ